MNKSDYKNAEMHLKVFYKNYFKDNVAHLMSKVVAGIMGFILIIWLCFPIEEESTELLTLWVPSCLAFMIAWMYILPYYNVNTMESGRYGKMQSIMKILRFVPVTKRDISIYLIRKVLKVFTILLILGLIGQFFFAWISSGTIGMWNFLYPFLVAFLIPVAIAIPMIWSVKE